MNVFKSCTVVMPTFECLALQARLILLCVLEKDSLYLMGLPNGNWELLLPVGPFPPELPEPTVGINFPRDGMQEKDWLVQVAVCSESWLVSVAFFTGSRCNFNKAKR